MPEYHAHDVGRTERKPTENLAAPALSSLQVLLWMGWTSAVIGHAYVDLAPTRAAAASIDLVGLVLHTALTGLIGLVCLTLIEQRLAPWRWYDDHEEP